MKRSIKYLPKQTQEELTILVKLISEGVKNVEMILLFGSYARNEHVLSDERFDFGTHTVFQSDLDILVVLSKGNILVAEQRLDDTIEHKYTGILNKLRPSSPDAKNLPYALPQFVVEFANELNKRLEKSQYFFTDIVKDGVMLYNTKNHKLAKPRELSYKEIKEIAVEEYDSKMKRGNVLLKHGRNDYIDGDYIDGSFQLHQACERYFNAISLVFTNYKGKGHKLKVLLGKVKKYSMDLMAVFPVNTPFERRCYSLICKAYIEARYNPRFVVTEDEYKYMLTRVEILKEITERVCTEKIRSYDLLIAEQEGLN